MAGIRCTVPGAVVPDAAVPGTVVVGAGVPGALVAEAAVPRAVVAGAAVPGAVLRGAVVAGAVVVGPMFPGAESLAVIGSSCAVRVIAPDNSSNLNYIPARAGLSFEFKRYSVGWPGGRPHGPDAGR